MAQSNGSAADAQQSNDLAKQTPAKNDDGNALDGRLFKRILTFLLPYKGWVALALLGTFAVAFLGPLMPKLVQVAIDDHIVVGDIDGLRLIGPPEGHEAEGGIVAVQMDGVHPHDLAVLLDAQGVMCRAGHHCTMPLHAHLANEPDAPQVETSLRASAYVYNPLAAADRLAAALRFAARALRGDRTTVFA